MPEHEDFDGEIDELSEDHEEAERALLEIVVAYAAGRIAAEEAAAQIGHIVEALAVAVADWIDDVLPRIYESGIRTAQRALGASDSESADEAMSRPEHTEILETEAERLERAMDGLSEQMARDAAGALDEIRRRNALAMMSKGRNAIPQAREMADEMRGRGIAFTDRSGRRWDPGAYARMVLRTHAVETSNAANLATAAELGSPGVRIRDGGPGDVDEPCKIANGQAWSLAYFAANLLEHPNCRRAAAPLPSTWSGELDRE